MATTTQVVFVDDLDGSIDGVEAVWFGLGDDLYEIDLRPAHRQQLRAALEPFMASARSLAEEDEEPSRPPRPPRPAGLNVAQRRSRVLAPARPVPMPFGHPDYPWIPLARTRDSVAEAVQRWAAERGIPMPDRGIPRSVLEAYRRYLKVAGTVRSTPQE